MPTLVDALVGGTPHVWSTILKTFALFLTAAVAFRLSERRTLGQFAPFDWVAATAVGAIIGRTATASDTSWLTGTAALVTLIVTHALIARLRLHPGMRKIVDPPLRVLIRDGQVDRRNLRRSGMTEADLGAALRRQGLRAPEDVHLAVYEAKGGVSVLRS